MPNINRVRVVNFRYDNDKKYIGDMLLDMNGKNSLLNLENGGGKSVILQLALQVLIPNCELSSRKFVDYFKVNSGTTHILIEWLLDSTVTEYFLTGICAARDSEGLKFFTYTHAYGKQNECDIRRIPVVNDRKQVTGYSEFYKFLRSVTEFRINTYSKDRMKDYREKLASNNLFENEFEAIRVINQSEGGIEKFFERARKSRNVIERLIIPAIPSLGGKEQNLLAGTFKKHFENLKSIPVLQYNLQIYEGFLKKGAELLKLLEEYQGLVQNYSGFKVEILTLENLLYIVCKRLTEEEEGYQTKIADMDVIEKDLEYKKDSLEIFVENRQIQMLEDRKIQKNTAAEVERQRLKAVRDKLKYMLAVNAYVDIKEQKNKQFEFNEKLRLLELEENEIQQEYQDSLFFLSAMLDKEIVRIKALIEEYIQKSKVIGQQLEGKKTQKHEIAEKKLNLSNDLAVCRSDKKRLDQEYKQHADWFSNRDMLQLLDPETALKNFRRSLEEAEKIKQEMADKMLQLLGQEEDTTIRLHNLDTEKKMLEERLSGKKKLEEAYNKKLVSLQEQLLALGIESNIYSGQVAEKLLKMSDMAATKLAGAQIDHNTIENKKLLLDGLDYFLPDKDILKVYEFLGENGIKAMPGSLWLKKQPEGKRAELLKQNPLISFSIIVDPTQIEKVAVLSESMAKLAQDYPVAIIAADSAGLNYSSDKETSDGQLRQNNGNLDRLNGSMVFILRSDSSSLLINDQELREFIGSLGRRLEKNQELIKALRADQDKMISIKERTNDFLVEYSLSWNESHKRDSGELNEKIANLEKAAEKLYDEMNKIQADMLNTREKMQKAEVAIREISADIQKMEGLINTQRALADCEAEIKRLAPLLKDVIEQEDVLEEEISELLTVQRVSEDKGRETEREAGRLFRRLEEIKRDLTITNPSKELKGSIDELESSVRAQKAKLSSGSRDSIEATIQAIGTIIEGLRRTITANGHSEQDFESVYEKVQNSEIVKAEEAEQKIEADVNNLETEYNSLEGMIRELNGYKSAHVQALEKQYGSGPFEFSASDSIEPKYYDEQIKTVKARKNKLSGKLKDIIGRKNDVEKQLGFVKQFIEDRNIKVIEGIKGKMLQLKGFEESIGLWDLMKMESGEMSVLFRRYKQTFGEIERKTEDGRKSVEECFDSLYRNEIWMDNGTLKSVLSGIMKENLFNTIYMQELFTRLFDSVGKMRDAEVLQLEECKRNKGELVERCLKRAVAVYDEVKLVDTFSKIKVNGENQKIVKIEMPKLDEEQGRSLMSLYIEECIEEIGRQKEQGSYDPLKIDTTINGYMSPQALLDAVINLNDITIKVFKPEHNLELSQYIPWEVVVQWSGGEKLAGFFAMFISIISYLRYKRTGWQGSTKVVWIDNPFGQANAGHLLEYIFELAKATNTQMICLTGLQETTIYSQFEVVYSLVHRMLSNMSIIQSKQVKSGKSIEAGFYNLKDGQMSFL